MVDIQHLKSALCFKINPKQTRYMKKEENRRLLVSVFLGP